MNKSLTSNDFELVLDAQTGDCPAVVKERLFETPPDQMPIDFARINNKHCWVVSSHDVYVWSVEAQSKSESRKSRLAHLRLPPSGLVYSSKLICVFEKQKQKTVSVLGISREGVARYWPNLTRDSYVDSVLDLNREVVLDIHLLEDSVTENSAEFILVTTSGSVYTLVCTSKGHIASSKIGNRETQGMATRISSFIFGNGGSQSEAVRATGSVIYWRESEEINSMDEETLEPMTVILGSKSIFAYDITNKSEVWTTDVKELLGEHVIQTMKMSADLDSTSITILDAQTFRKGLLVLLAATTASSDSVFFFLAHLVEFDYRKPKVDFFAEVPTSNQIEGMFDATDESSFVGQVYLCVPKETANAENMTNTDGILIIHPVFVESVFIPNDDSSSEITFSKALVMATNDQIIGYGADDNYCYAMLTDGRISALRLLPRGFGENSMTDDISILEVIANTERPQHDNVSQGLYDAFAAFCNKNLASATTGMHSLNHTSKDDLLKNIRNFLWAVVQDIDNDCDLESELREKKKFCEYFYLFLKHTEVLNHVLEARIMHPQLDCIMTGNEILSEITERLQVLLTLVQWQSVNPDHADVLGHIVKDIGKESGIRGNEKELKFEHVHLLPRSVVRLCTSLISASAFKSATQRYETLCLGADILHEFSVAVALSRRMGSNFPINRMNTKWTTALAEYYSEMSTLLLDELNEPAHEDLERKKFKDYSIKLVTFHLNEILKKSDGHPVLTTLAEIGEVTQTIELAERFKDFKILCMLTLQLDKSKRNAKLDAYKVRFSADDFETYLYNYMNKKHMYDDLLNQKGERADKFISTLDHIRWRRELQQENYSEASKTLLVECERETSDVQKQKTLSSLAKLAFLCQDEGTKNAEDLDEIDLNQRMVQYQESIPEALIKNMYPDNPDRPLSADELVEISKLRLEEPTCTLRDFAQALIFIARLRKWMPERDYTNALNQVWVGILKMDKWEKVTAENMHKTNFSVVIKKLLEDEKDLAKYALPDTTVLLKSFKDGNPTQEISDFIKSSVKNASKKLFTKVQ